MPGEQQTTPKNRLLHVAMEVFTVTIGKSSLIFLPTVTVNFYTTISFYITMSKIIFPLILTLGLREGGITPDFRLPFSKDWQ